MPLDLQLIVHLAVALGIGALIGLEREQSEDEGVFAGSRTLPLVALLGALVQALVPGLLLAAFAAVALAVVVAYVAKAIFRRDPGLTTAIASILTFLYGVLATHPAAGPIYTVVLGTATVAILASKRTLHGLARRVDADERRAMVTFLVLALVVLPLLPDRATDALLGLNPRFVWLMVVFVSGIELAAYLGVKLWGARGGLGVTGLLGGLVSSTATTVSMAQRARGAPNLATVCALGAVLASLVMLPRVLLEVAVVNPGLLLEVAVPLGAMLVGGLAGAGVLYRRSGRSDGPRSEVSNPFHLSGALLFGGLFALILLASEHANALFGQAGVYATALVSGVADVDAITLSMSRLAGEGRIPDELAASAIVLAIVSNTAVKAGIAWVLGNRRIGRDVTAALGVVALIGVAALWLL